jgi:lipoate-protein ligase A
MALDQALLHAADQTGLRALRLYGWNPATLSFGRNEPAARRYDRAAIARQGIATVRRPTGGRAVWHHREVTYAVAAPVTTFGTLQQTYQEIHAMLAAALRRLGAPVALAAPRGAAPLGAGACFAAPAGGEVIAEGGGKVVGSAQVRAGNAFLQHGSIILENDQPLVDALVSGAAAPSHAAGLASLLHGPSTAGRVSAAIADEARARWHMDAPGTAWPARLREHARELLPRFRSDEWTWRR